MWTTKRHNTNFVVVLAIDVALLPGEFGKYPLQLQEESYAANVTTELPEIEQES